MLDRKDVAVVLDEPQIGGALVLFIGDTVYKDLAGTEVIGRRIEPDDEVAWEEILPVDFVIAVRVDEDVGERCGSVTNVTAATEQGEE